MTARQVFRLALVKQANLTLASAFVAQLMCKIDENWDLLVRTYEGPGK